MLVQGVGEKFWDPLRSGDITRFRGGGIIKNKDVERGGVGCTSGGKGCEERERERQIKLVGTYCNVVSASITDPRFAPLAAGTEMAGHHAWPGPCRQW